MSSDVRLALIALLALVACDGARHYATRGLVRGHEGSGDDERIAIHHERIASFEDRDGKRAPMSSMTMIFGFAPGLGGQPFRVGSKVHIEFDVRWDQSPLLVITRIDPLPQDSALQLDDAHAHP